MPPGSYIRRRFLKRVIAWGFEALSREDIEVPLLFYDPGAEIEVIGERLRALGFAERYSGHEGIRQFLKQWRAEWSEVRWTPNLLIDRGDQVIVRAATTARGAASDAETTQTAGYVYDLGKGVVVRIANYYEWSACAAAVGVDENAQVPVSPVA